ncbi:MAG: hypothetical protein E6Q75_11235 [Rheinheimera sp.]|nr:MAG: hypothetical protein E6Q75_11235 [Rheinheimera sp.]
MLFVFLASTLLFLLLGVFAGGSDDPKMPGKRVGFVVYFLSFYAVSQWSGDKFSLADLGVMLSVILSYLVGVRLGRQLQQHFSVKSKDRL